MNREVDRTLLLVVMGLVLPHPTHLPVDTVPLVHREVAVVVLVVGSSGSW